MPTDDQVTRKLRAILSADVKGYSLLMADDEAFTVRTLKAYRTLMSAQIEQHNGRVVDALGDNLLAEFESAVDAVQCSVEIQKILKEKNEGLPLDKRLEFRIGVNIGDVIQDGESLYGEGINIAARIEGLAEPGGVCISRNAYDHIRNKLGLGYEYLGGHSVKNIEHPVRVYKVLIDPKDVGKLIGEKPKPSAKKWILPAVVIATIVLSLIIWQSYQTESEPTEKPSIAVLPFENMSNDPEQEYFSDGMTDELISDLAKINDIFVISRNSVFTYKGKPIKIQQVAKELNVQYILEGSIQRSGNKVRIRAQLINGKTDHHIWSESYDGVMDNIFDLQDKITGEIVTALKIKFDVGRIGHSKKKETQDVRAYEYFLKGWNHYLLTTKNDFIKAIDLYQKALEIDPEYSRVCAALALVHKVGAGPWLDVMAGSRGVNKNLVMADKYLKRAMKDPTSIAYAVSSRILLGKRQYKEAIAQAEKGISLDHSELSTRFSLVHALIFSGRPEQSLSQIEEILWLDPINPARAYLAFGLAYYCMGNLQTAYEYIEKAKKHNPMIGCSIRAVVYVNKGMKEEASMAASECQPLNWDSIRVRMGSHPFKDKELAENFANGLYSAGVPGEASKYYKIYDEYKLNEDAIRNLLVNQKFQVYAYFDNVWSLSFSDENVCTYTGVQPTEKGAYWFEKDSIWLDMPQRFYGEKWQANVYKNPDGSWEVGNLYFFVSSFGIFPFSHEEE